MSARGFQTRGFHTRGFFEQAVAPAGIIGVRYYYMTLMIGAMV